MMDPYSNSVLESFSQMVLQNMNRAENPTEVPEAERETVDDYINMVKAARPSVTQAAIIAKMRCTGFVPRIRRKLLEGSYPNLSVDEKGMKQKKQHLLRYTWKAKLQKLSSYLESSKATKEINLQDKCGRTACHFAASWDCPRTLDLLLVTPGIDVNIQDDEGKTPLRKAVEINSSSCVELLVQHGADPLIPALDGRNPFEYALQEIGDEAETVVSSLYALEKVAVWRKDKGRLTYLHQVCLAPAAVAVVKIARELVEYGSHLNATEGSGKTPLMVAVQMKRSDVVKLFLDMDADFKHKDFEGHTALDYSVSCKECCDLLRERYQVITQDFPQPTIHRNIAWGNDSRQAE